MQEGQDQGTHEPAIQSSISHSQENVGFPRPIEKKRKSPKALIFAGLGLILIGGAAFFVLSGGNNDEETEVSPSPRVAGIDFIVTPTPQSLPTSTPAINKEALTIQILNGTGIPGEAGYLDTQLKSMGYSKTETGNASGPSVSATSMTYSSSVPQSVVDEIKTKLESIYKTVEAKSGTTGKDIKIIVGLRKGATPKASATSTPAGTAKASPSSSPKPTGTASPSASPN